MATEISILNRAGIEKAKITYDKNETVRELKKRIASQIKLSPARQYLTLGKYSTSQSDAKRVVLSDNTKTLGSYPLAENQYTITVKDLGPQVGWRTVFLVEYGGPLAIFVLNFLLASALGFKVNSDIQRLALLLAVIHYAKREFETVFVHIFSNGTMPLKNIFKNSFHYWFLCGTLISTELFYFWKDPEYSTTVQYILAAFFLLFEFLNLMCHITLRKLRTAGGKENSRGIPRGWGFDFVSCANYYWEALVWLTFAILVRCWTAYLFFAVSFGQMLIWALKKHRAYRKEFDGKEGRQAYPRGRKAMVPFII